MAYSFIQGNTTQNGNTASVIVAVTLTAPVAVGDALFVSVGFNTGGGGVLTSIGDDKGNVYTLVDAATSANAGWNSAYCLNITNAPQTITAHLSLANTFATIVVDEFAGVVSGSVLDKHNINLQAASTTTAIDAITSGNVTTTGIGDLIYGSCVCVNSSGLIIGTGFTQDQSVVSTWLTEHLTQSSSGTLAATYTASSAAVSDYMTAIMTFKPPASGRPAVLQGYQSKVVM